MVSYRIPGPVGQSMQANRQDGDVFVSRQMHMPGPLGQYFESESLCNDDSLTVFLGGAGMVGAYNQDFVDAFTLAGLSNVVYANYSGLIEGVDSVVPDLVDMLGDASILVFYNQSSDDPIVLHFAKVDGCTLKSEREFLGVRVRVYEGETWRGEQCDSVVVRIELSGASTLSFSLSDLNVNRCLPIDGHLNLVGYSWGGVVAARSAIYHANLGTKIGSLVLLGAPINYSLLQAVKKHPNIQNLIVKNLEEQGDPVYAGMTDAEIIEAAPSLGRQMQLGTGHFYYSADNGQGRSRRRLLARELVSQGLR